MERQKVKNCIDSGGNFCPCNLAYSNDCIRCNMLNNNNCCDCVWQGVCILNTLNHNKLYKPNERKQYLCKIVENKEIEKDVYLMKINIPNELSKDLYRPGSYVMLKSKEKNSDIFNTPISIMDIENDILEVVIRSVGPKTKAIVKSSELYVKGPYFNGIFGLDNINKAFNEKCMLILSGLSQVNAIKVVKKLIDNNRVDVFINSDGILIDEVTNKIKDLGANIYYFDINDLEVIRGHIKENNIGLVYCASNLAVSKIIRDIVDSIDDTIKLSISNNNLICCGEGMCGACGIEINGEIVKTCKSQIDSRIFLDAKFK